MLLGQPAIAKPLDGGAQEPLKLKRCYRSFDYMEFNSEKVRITIQLRNISRIEYMLSVVKIYLITGNVLTFDTSRAHSCKRHIRSLLEKMRNSRGVKGLPF